MKEFNQKIVLVVVFIVIIGIAVICIIIRQLRIVVIVAVLCAIIVRIIAFGNRRRVILLVLCVSRGTDDRVKIISPIVILAVVILIVIFVRAVFLRIIVRVILVDTGLKPGGKVTWFDVNQYDGLEAGTDYIFGGRSFTLFKVTRNGLEEAFDSGSDFERITNEKLPEYFNCSNDDIEKEDRSGKKGSEPESVTVGTVGGKTYAFIALELIGGVMVYDITAPENTEFVNYINSREFNNNIQGDVSPEGLCFIPAAQSKTGKPLLLAACEVSGTLAVYELTGEQDETPDIPSVPGIDPILAAILTAANQQRFEDVVSDAYCYDAVNWAVERNITSGTGKYTFSPDSNCTRADFVTFLWRAAGKPVVNYAMNFSDVKESSYYAEAVRWAASLGIVTGLSKNTFGAANAVTREQAVTMLWRFAKQQGFDTTQGGMAIREFDDYDSLSEYAREAMAWAVNAGILKGSGNRLMPDADCTRAQLVTLLYRLESQTR
jgi:hypothetical protein